MAVYERTYRPYAGPLSPPRRRWTVVSRYALGMLPGYRLQRMILSAWLVWVGVLMILIYLPHNETFIRFFQLQEGALDAVFRFDAAWFRNWFARPMLLVSFLVSVLAGPHLLFPDLRQNGLALILARPIGRTGYLFGKAVVLMGLLSLITWVPALLLYGFQASLAGADWWARGAHIGPALFAASWTWVLLLTSLALVASAYARHLPLAQAALLAVYFIPSVFGGMVNLRFDTVWGSLLSLPQVQNVLTASLLGVPAEAAPPAAACWTVWAGVTGMGLLLVFRRVRAYRVVR